MQSKLIGGQTKLSIFAVGLLSFIGILVETSMNVTFPTLMREMHVTLATVQWLTTAYLLMVTIAMSTTAFILKRFSFRSLFFFAALMSLSGTITALLSRSFGILLAGRLLQAVATGIATPLMFQLVFTRIPAAKIGLWTGLASIIISLAPALGPTYGGILTSLWSWRIIFLGVLPVLLLAVIIGAANLHGAALETGGQKFDFGGMILLALTFASFVLAFNVAGTHGWLSLPFAGSVVIVALLVTGMSYYARHGRRHLFDYSILRSAVLRQRLLQYFGLQLINIGLSFVLPIFVQSVLHSSPMAAGLMLLPGALLGAIIAPLAGRLYDRRGANLPLLTSASLAAVAMLLFVICATKLTGLLITLLYILLRLGFNTGFGPAVSDASLHVSKTQKADQNSMFSMMQQFAGSLGTGLMSAVIAAASLHARVIPATVSGARIDFVILLLMAMLILTTGIAVAKKKSA